MCGFLLIKVPGDIPLNQCHNSRYIFGQAHNIFQDGNLSCKNRNQSLFLHINVHYVLRHLESLKSQVTHGGIERMLRTVWKSGLLFLSWNALEWLFKILQGLQGKPTTYRLTWHSGTGNWFHYVKKNHAQLGVVFPCLSPQPSHSLGQDVISKPWVIVKGLMWFYLSMKLFVAFPGTHSSYMPRSCSHSGKLRRRKSRQTGLLSEHVLSWSLEMGEDRSLENWGYVHNYTYIIMSYPIYTQCNSNLYYIDIYVLL